MSEYTKKLIIISFFGFVFYFLCTFILDIVFGIFARIGMPVSYTIKYLSIQFINHSRFLVWIVLGLKITKGNLFIDESPKLNLKVILFVCVFFISINLVYRSLYMREVYFSKFNLNDLRYIHLIIQGVLLAPILEEIVFRKILLSYYRKKYSIFLSIILTSLLFTLVHELDFYVYILVFPFSIFVSILYIKSNSLLLVILAHSSFNLLYSIKFINTEFINVLQKNYLPVFKISFPMSLLSGFIVWRLLKEKNKEMIKT